ncbi:MAG: hypothetical protein J0L93_03550 [Deltaproteobacteria bacterium]|nr:hypothetical protein [Deltaproteobacteria bacterium]
MKKTSQMRANLSLLLSLCVISTIFFTPQSSEAMIFKPLEAKSVCFISFSSKISEEVRSAVRNILRDYFDGDCSQLQSSMEDPFLDSSKSMWPKVQGLGLWLGSSNSSQELSMRGFDLESGLEFGSAKNISLKNLIPALLKQHPMVGIIRPTGFVIWKDIGSANVQVFERRNVKRHPLLPHLLEISGAVKKTPLLKQKEGDLVSSSDFSLDTTASLWLKVLEAHE